MDKILRFLETYKGRDRILRLFCYSTKCAAGLIKSPQVASQFDNFSKQLSTSRACFRLLDDLPAIADVASKNKNQDETTIEKIVNTLEVLVDLIFSPLDHISWAIGHKIIISDNPSWDTASTACWVISLYISIFKVMKKLSLIAKKKLKLGSQANDREIKKQLSAEQWKLELTGIKCLSDLLFAVNYFPKGILWGQYLSKWLVGALGTFSSIVSLYQALML